MVLQIHYIVPSLQSAREISQAWFFYISELVPQGRGIGHLKYPRAASLPFTASQLCKRIQGKPEYVLTGDPEYIKQLVDDLIYKDIISRHKIKDETSVRDFSAF